MSGLLTSNKYTRYVEQDIEKLQIRVQNLESAVFRIEKAEETSLAQQILLLKYIGITSSISNIKKQQARFLSKLLNRSEEHIRRTLSKITEIENTQNLEAVKKVFTELNMKELSEKVEKDIQKLNKK